MRRLLMAGICMCATVLAQENPAWPLLKPVTEKKALPGTKLLEIGGDLSIAMVEGVDRFLDAEIAKVMQERGQGTRQDLARILGMPRDGKPTENGFEHTGQRW
ncbi:MAG: hypothetical protein QF706_07190, partial [Roseibacillus sp.]|nr:hypothetical protein [Roseibacillus sp.]